MLKKILAVELPAPCPLACAFCRTPEHAVGDPERVFNAIKDRLSVGGYDELYLTSNGETGLSSIFRRVIELAQGFNVPTAVLCATAKSVVPGLVRVEVSLNEYTRPLSERAIEKAFDLRVPVVISTVDTAETVLDPKAIADEYSVPGVLVCALQREGRSKDSAGTTRIFQRPGVALGAFPAAAYAELRDLAHVAKEWAVTCINPFGNEVPLLGGAGA